MSSYKAITTPYLHDANENVVGVLGPDGREWTFPGTLSVGA